MSSVYQSPGDKMRYEILVKSLIEGRLNLAVLSESDLTLDFYANAIHDDLRARGERMVEFCFSADSAKLVEMFNGILSELTVSQARDKQVKSAPKRYLIFRDIMAMQEFELQLLARLVNGFPASQLLQTGHIAPTQVEPLAADGMAAVATVSHQHQGALG